MDKGAIQPFYLAYCGMKPVDIPRSLTELKNFKHSRSDKDMEKDELFHPIKVDEYAIKCPTAVMPEEVVKRVNALSVTTRNLIFKESVIVPDAKSQYYDYREMRNTPRGSFFVLTPTTFSQMMAEFRTGTV